MQTRFLAVGALAVVGACADPATSLTTATTEEHVAGTTSSAQVPADYLHRARSLSPRERPGNAAHHGVIAHLTSGLAGVDSVASFSDSFTIPGFDSSGAPQSVWPYTMVGGPPERNHPTVVRAPVIPVTVELLDASGQVGTSPNGSPLRMTVDPDIVGSTVHSPVFEPFRYTSGFSQFTDGMMRAQFWNRIGDGDGDGDDSGYHTVLFPSVKTTRTIQVPFGMYRFAPKADGSCCLFVLVDATTFGNAIFPPTPTDTTTVIGQAEQAHEMTTRDISTLLLNNVYLYDGDPANCCILGFHSYDAEPGDASNGNRERRYVMNYSSWITPGLFGGGFADITAFSHEMAELFADPFVDNATPWWLSQDPYSGASLCQNNLETGDVIEVLSSNAIHAIPMHGRTYHVQNEALLPWFASESPSSAHLGAYSFPDETTVLGLSPHPLQVGCVPSP